MEKFFLILNNIGIFDAILILIIFIFTTYGFMKGIIKMIGDLAGSLIGIYVAGHYFSGFYNWTQSLYLGHQNVGLVISFLILLLVVRKLVLLIVILIDKFFDILAIIPFFSLINRLAGAIFGFLTINITLGVLIYMVSRYSLGFLADKLLISSNIAKLLLAFGEFVSPLLPEILRGLHSLL